MPTIINNAKIESIKFTCLLISYLLLNHFLFDRVIALWRKAGWFESYVTLTITLLFHLVCFISLYYISISRLFVKITVGLFFTFSSFLYITYFFVSSAQITFFEFHSLYSSRVVAFEAIETYRQSIIYGALITIPFIIVLFLFPKVKTSKIKSIISTLVLIVLVFSVSVIVFHKKTGAGTFGLPSQLIIPAFFIDYSIELNTISGVSEERDIPLSGLSNYNNILLILDESIRADFIDFNENKNTTPSFIRSNNVLNLGYAASYSNCSQYTNVLLRTLTRFGSEKNDVRGKRYLWDIMNAAGYNNILIDAQQNGKNSNFFTEEELIMGQVKNIPAAALKSDTEIVNMISDEIKNNDKNFFFIIKKGSHFPFDNKDIIKYFTPIMTSSNLKTEQQENIINSYKNLIRYNTDDFINALNELDDNRAIYIYTSDHGQNFENLNNKMTHCSAQNPSHNEGLVPLALFGGMNKSEFSALTQKIINNDKHSHYDIPYLLMSFSGYSDKNIIEFLGEHVATDQFLYGNVYGFFDGEPSRKSIIKAN